VAVRLSQNLGLRLVLVHVADGFEAPADEGMESLTTTLARHGARRLLAQVAIEHGLGDRAVQLPVVGSRAERLAAAALQEDAGLIVLGARKPGRFRSSRRSGLADELAQLAPCPVVVAATQTPATLAAMIDEAASSW